MNEKIEITGNGENQLDSFFFNSQPTAIYICNKEGYITSYNKTAVTLWGKEPELGKQHWYTSLLLFSQNGEPLKELDCPMGKTLKYGTEESGKVILLERPDKTRLIARPHTIPTFNSLGEQTGAIATVFIENSFLETEQKQALLASIVNSSEDAIISKSIDGTISSWNRAAEQLFGYSDLEIIGKHISLLIPESRLQEEDFIFQKILEGKNISDYETVRVNKKGQEVPVSITISPIINRIGEIIGASKIARNIEEKLKSEEKQAVLAAIVESSENAIISKSLEGVITSWNRSATRIFGYEPHEIIGKNISILIPTDRAEEEIGILKNITAGKKINPFETIRIAKDGTEIPVSLTVSPITDKRGNIIGASKIVRNITQQLEAQKNYERLYEQVKAMNDKKDEFIGIASHELKTPISSIYGYLQILDRYIEEEKTKKFLHKTIRQVQKLTQLVSDMLDVSKIEAGKLLLNKDFFDLEIMVSNVIELVDQTHSERTIKANYSAEACFVYGDERRLEQVLTNFLTNAIKYSPIKEPIDVYINKTNSAISVGVKDYGTGIPDEKREHIFDKFYRIDDNNKNASGLGIGLYISSQIIERHHGKIWFECNAGEGSTFWFSLPVNQI